MRRVAAANVRLADILNDLVVVGQFAFFFLFQFFNFYQFLVDVVVETLVCPLDGQELVVRALALEWAVVV